MTTPATDYNQQLLAYLQTWRQFLEQSTTDGARTALPGRPSAMPFTPPCRRHAARMPACHHAARMPPTAQPPCRPRRLDYTQQLLGYLQAWRHYLEQATGAATGPPAVHPTADAPTADVPGARARVARPRLCERTTCGGRAERRPDTARPADEPAPDAASLDDARRSTSPSERAPERGFGSAYSWAAGTPRPRRVPAGRATIALLRSRCADGAGDVVGNRVEAPSAERYRTRRPN